MNTLRPLLEQSLPEVARRAGRPALDVLQGRLERLIEDDGLQGLGPVVAFARLVPRLAREVVRVEDEADGHRETLAIARAHDNEAAALVEVLTWTEEGEDLAEDIAAIRRHLDSEAIEDRLLLRVHHLRQQWELLALATAALPHEALSDEELRAARDAAAELLARPRRPWTLRAAACRLAGALCGRPSPGEGAVRQALLDLTHARREDPWVQVAALEAWLALSEPADRDSVLRNVLATREPEDHRFVRARACELAVRHGHWDLVRETLQLGDPSEHVLCTAARELSASPHPLDRAGLLGVVRTEAIAPRVRAAGVVAALPEEGSADDHWLDLVSACFEEGRDPWLVEVVVRSVLDRVHLVEHEAARCRERWGSALRRLAEQGPPDLAIQAATLLLTLDVLGDPVRRDGLAELQRFVEGTTEGAVRTFRHGPLASLTPDEILDVLAVAAADGVDLSARPLGPGEPPRRGYRIWHGVEPRFAWWRLGYEVARPRPDKRQGWSFVTDRVPRGSLVALSNRGAEVTPTAVPGQKNASPTRLAWGAELPLPALLLAASRGTIRVRAPHVAYDVRPTRRLAGIAAHRHYTRLAGLREKLLVAGRAPEPAAYDAELAKVGFSVERRAWLPVLPELVSHLVALDSNTVPQLALLSAGLVGFWTARNLERRRKEHAWRANIPLVIGGWGSRGKSGTERLKAAVLHGVGYTVVSKTTGCEAMVVSSIPGREPTEIFLYRPYDKATIFEQRAVLEMASRMDAQVLLWECMALNPSYVQILQQDWVRDDLTTITNTYPDHEDIQGPTGRDVAEVIGQFVPRRGTVFTSEQHMTPVLVHQARRMGSDIDVVRPEDWQLLPADLLARYPYNEHPRNIALVCKLMARLGIRRDVALKAMADHVVPDLGVLKEYGPVDYDGRTATFVNGCSANERAGFLSNWERMGFDAQTPASGLDDFTALVVNNRADRLARQAVFARIAALDATFDAVVVIGTNVASFHLAYKQHVEVDLRKHLHEVAGKGRAALVEEIARRLRRSPLDRPAAYEHAVKAGGDPKTVDALIARLWEAPPPVAELAAHPLRKVGLKGIGTAEAVEQWLRETAWLFHLSRTDFDVGRAVDGAVAALLRRAVPLTNPDLTGDQVLHLVAMTAPPGARMRMKGSQNIKGTGLDFVYRWLSADRVAALVGTLETADALQAGETLRMLDAHPNWGVADSTVAVAALEAQMPRLARFDLETPARALLDRLARRSKEARAGLEATGELSRWDKGRRWLKKAFDFHDSVKRRKEAEALYRDLAHRRVGQDAAARVAKHITTRQK